MGHQHEKCHLGKRGRRGSMCCPGWGGRGRRDGSKHATGGSIRSSHGPAVCLRPGSRTGSAVPGGASSTLKPGGGCWTGILVLWQLWGALQLPEWVLGGRQVALPKSPPIVEGCAAAWGGLPGGGGLDRTLMGMRVSVRAKPSVSCRPRFPQKAPCSLGLSREPSSGIDPRPARQGLLQGGRESRGGGWRQRGKALGRPGTVPPCGQQARALSSPRGTAGPVCLPPSSGCGASGRRTPRHPQVSCGKGQAGGQLMLLEAHGSQHAPAPAWDQQPAHTTKGGLLGLCTAGV